MNSGLLYAELGFEESNTNSISEAFDWDQAFVNSLLELEQKVSFFTYMTWALTI